MGDLKKNISVVSQDSYIFNMSIRDNLLLVKPDASKRQLDDVCKKAKIYDYIMELPERYNTIVGMDGVNLSGGQRQKIAIARVFASSSPIIILDEPTSALDPIAEKNINDEIMQLCEKENKTLIIISHRLSTIVNVDKIYMMKEGEIIEEGTHNELMNKKSAYYEMFEAQAKLYREKDS